MRPEEYAVEKAYNGGHVLSACTSFGELVNVLVPSYSIHFGQLSFIKIPKILAACVYGLAHFAQIGHRTNVERNPVRYWSYDMIGQEREEHKNPTPRDIYEYTDFCFDKIYSMVNHCVG